MYTPPFLFTIVSLTYPNRNLPSEHARKANLDNTLTFKLFVCIFLQVMRNCDRNISPKI